MLTVERRVRSRGTVQYMYSDVYVLPPGAEYGTDYSISDSVCGRGACR